MSPPSPPPVATVRGLDHLVLTVRDVDATIAFYRDVVGLEPVEFAGGRRGLRAGEHKINLHQAGREHVPHAAAPAPGAGDFCLRVTEDVERLAGSLRSHGVTIEHGPVDKVGARARLRSIYFRDPDGNLVELANEGGSA